MNIITVIDGDSSIRANIKDLLEINGYNVNDIDKIENFDCKNKKGKQRIIISDIPEDKERRKCYFSSLKSNSIFCDVPVLFLGSSENLSILNEKICKNAKFLLKPFRVDELLFYTKFLMNKVEI